jgi:hypothetical protein
VIHYPRLTVVKTGECGSGWRISFVGQWAGVARWSTSSANEEEQDGFTGDGPDHRHKDKDYNVIWFTEQCLSNVLRLETYVEDAEREGDSELADFFRRAQEASRKGAEQGKEILVIVGIVLMFVWSFWLGLIIVLIGLIAFGGFARGKWY